MLRVGISVAVAAAFMTCCLAQTPKPATEAPTCPVCHMPLSKKKTKDNPVAVKLDKKSKVMYCCSKCTMPDDVLVKKKKK